MAQDEDEKNSQKEAQPMNYSIVFTRKRLPSMRLIVANGTHRFGVIISGFYETTNH
jgi:hypothetical protein